MSHSCPNLVSTTFLYNPYIPFLIFRNYLFAIIVSFHFLTIDINIFSFHNHSKEIGYSVAITKPWLGALQC